MGTYGVLDFYEYLFSGLYCLVFGFFRTAFASEVCWGWGVVGFFFVVGSVGVGFAGRGYFYYRGW